MKRKLIILAVPILLLLVSAYGQTQKPIEVTKQTLTRQRAGQPYIIDLSRKGKTYAVTTDVAGRVRIRTAKGEMAMTEMMSKLGVTSNKFLAGSKFIVAAQSDLHTVKFPPASRRLSTATAKGLTCGIIICTCDPDIEGDCFGRGIVCAAPMVCWVCDGPDCSPEQTNRWTCACIHI